MVVYGFGDRCSREFGKFTRVLDYKGRSKTFKFIRLCRVLEYLFIGKAAVLDYHSRDVLLSYQLFVLVKVDSELVFASQLAVLNSGMPHYAARNSQQDGRTRVTRGTKTTHISTQHWALSTPCDSTTLYFCGVLHSTEGKEFCIHV